MYGIRLNRILIGTALALVLATPAAFAQSDDAAINAAVPMPNLTDDMPPPTIADIGPVAAPQTTPPAPVAAAPAPATESAKPSETVEIAKPAPIVVMPPQTTATAAPVAPATPAEPAAPVVTQAPAAAPSAPAPAATASTPAATPAPAAAPAPVVVAATIDPADQEIADKIREITEDKKFDRVVSGKKERTAMDAVYDTRKHMPLWFEKGAPSPRAKAVIARITAADQIGLDPSDYKLPDLAAAATADARAEAELRFTNVVLAFARHVQSGRTSPGRISSNIEYAVPTPDPSDVLMKVAGSTDIPSTFAGFEPPHAGYQALKKKLTDVRAAKEEGGIKIANGAVLKVGTAKKPTNDPRVPMLRERLKVEGDAADLTYDQKLADAVKTFQKSAGLQQTGQLTQSTIDALNGPRKDKQIDAIVATMERWRWMPRDLGKVHVILNIPDFTLRVMDDGKVRWRTRVVVGKPATATPIFSSKIENILVNPTWHVPESIIYGEYMPAEDREPGILSRMGLKIDKRADGTVGITQPPGPGNALGRIKFNFQNRFQVYQHDTPDKNLFAHDRRAYSHGCMRVQNPDQYGEVLASYGLPGQGYTAEKLTSMFGKGEAWLKFTNQIPVHLTYQTAFVDDQGKLVVRDDIYNIDTRVLAAFKGADRNYGDAEDEMAAARRQNISAERAKYRNRIAAQEASPLERLFGGLFRN